MLVIDRGGWIQANADGFRQVIRPLMAKMREKRGAPSGRDRLDRFARHRPGGRWACWRSCPTRFSVSSIRSGPDLWNRPGGNGRDTGRLLLVAPNIVHVERELGVDPRDFRLWVCLHEETHRVQFTAVPWLRDHLLGEMTGLLESTDLDPQKLASLVRDGVERVGKLAKGDSGVSLLDVMQTPEQKEVVERITAVMSLLEGHADVVMDGVGPR